MGDHDTVCPACAASRTIAGYATHWDARDLDAFTNLFSETGSLEFRYADEAVVLRGRAAIAEFAEDRWRALVGVDTRHLQGVPLLSSAAGGTIVASTTVLVTHVTPNAAPSITQSGRYDDVLRLDGRRWRFERRCLDADVGPTR